MCVCEWCGITPLPDVIFSGMGQGISSSTAHKAKAVRLIKTEMPDIFEALKYISS